MVIPMPYVYNGNSYTGKTTPIYIDMSPESLYLQTEMYRLELVELV